MYFLFFFLLGWENGGIICVDIKYLKIVWKVIGFFVFFDIILFFFRKGDRMGKYDFF